MKTIKIDRSLPFNPETFIAKYWEIKEQYEESLSITKIDLDKIILAVTEDQKVHGANPRTIPYSLRKEGYILLDAQILKKLWENKRLIPKQWKEKVNGKTQYILFCGTILNNQHTDDVVLNLSFQKNKWKLSHSFFESNYEDGTKVVYEENALSAVIKKAV